jgi:peptidoglycan/xylan/chitin deacetylase (PgdA/CDA1 family)
VFKLTPLFGRLSADDAGNVYGRRGFLVRVAYLLAAMACWLCDGLLRRKHGDVVVLCYHGISARQRGPFARQMSRIAGRSIDVEEAGRTLRVAHCSPRVCVTFDDAFASLLENALPILREYRIPSVVFAVVDNLGSTPRWQMPTGHPEKNEVLMSSEQVRMIVENGLCRIGSHTLTHQPLAAVGPEELRRQLLDSKAKLECLLQREVSELALPHGSFDDGVLEAATQAGYRRIFTLEPSLWSAGQAERVIGRFLMSPDVWRIEFMLTCAGAYSYLYYWRRFLRRLRAWFSGRQDHRPF